MKLKLIFVILLCMLVLGCNPGLIYEGDSIEELTSVRGEPNQIEKFFGDGEGITWIPEGTEDEVDYSANVLIYYYKILLILF